MQYWLPLNMIFFLFIGLKLECACAARQNGCS